MDTACRTIASMLDLKRRGGRLLRRDNTTALLIDYDFVPQNTIDAICTVHPCLHVYTHQSDSSSSGYVVVFAYEYRPSWICTGTFLQLVICLLVVTLTFFNSYVML